MEINIRIEPQKNEIAAIVKINKCDISASVFYLNRDFIIDLYRVDGREIDVLGVESLYTAPELDGYMVKSIEVPPFKKEIVFAYHGRLSGTSGCFPYAREKITAAFTLLRWETFCYPVFSSLNKERLMPYLQEDKNAAVLIDIPGNYTAVVSGNLIEAYGEEGRKKYSYIANWHNLNCAVAQYKKSETFLGKMYFMSDFENKDFFNEVMKKAYDYMNEHFGKREIIADTRYAVIPSGLGSFVTDTVVYVEESAFKSIINMSQIIHEFIHLGWNAMATGNSQRIRFFDEGFTCYFEDRIMQYLLSEEQYNQYAESRINMFRQQKKDMVLDVAIADFYKYNYGDLSYTMGALCLKELTQYIGSNNFDRITREFLMKYKDQPVDINRFCREYNDRYAGGDLEDFFEKWIYTTNGYKKYIG